MSTEVQLIPMKTRGRLTVYRRQPKPCGKGYVVFMGDRVLEEFSRYASAVRWMKGQKEANEKRV